MFRVSPGPHRGKSPTYGVVGATERLTLVAAFAEVEDRVRRAGDDLRSRYGQAFGFVVGVGTQLVKGPALAPRPPPRGRAEPSPTAVVSGYDYFSTTCALGGGTVRGMVVAPQVGFSWCTSRDRLGQPWTK